MRKKKKKMVSHPGRGSSKRGVALLRPIPPVSGTSPTWPSNSPDRFFLSVFSSFLRFNAPSRLSEDLLERFFFSAFGLALVLSAFFVAADGIVSVYTILNQVYDGEKDNGCTPLKMRRE